MIKAIAENGDKKLLGDVEKRVRVKIGQVMLRLQCVVQHCVQRQRGANEQLAHRDKQNRDSVEFSSVVLAPLTTTKIHEIGDR